jgi:ketosteroid isomerase-like protein
MTEESTTPDLVELVRRAVEVMSGRDLDAVMRLWAPDGVFDLSRTAGVAPRGRTAIRSFLEEWIGSYEEWEIAPEELLDLGNGVVFSVHHQTGRPRGVTGRVEQRDGYVYLWVEDLMVQLTAYPYSDIDEARAAAKRLAKERG